MFAVECVRFVIPSVVAIVPVIVAHAKYRERKVSECAWWICASVACFVVCYLL